MDEIGSGKHGSPTGDPERRARTAPSAPGAVPGRGYFYVAAAALLWAVSGSSAKFLFHQGITPLQLVQLRVTLAAGLLLCWLLCLGRSSLLRISRRDILYFAILGTTGLAMVQFTYLLTISKIKVAAAILLEYLAPIFIALYTVIIMRERMSRTTFLAIAGATTGCYLVVGGYNFDLLSENREGIVCGILSAISFGWFSVYGERGMGRYSPWTVFFYALLFAAIFWNIAHLFWPAAPLPGEALLRPYSMIQWTWILYIVILGTVLPFGLYLEGINLIRSTRASITATLEPLTAGIISFLFLGESLELLQIAGGLLVIASVIMLQLRKERDDNTPALIRMRRQTAETL